MKKSESKQNKKKTLQEHISIRCILSEWKSSQWGSIKIFLI